MASAEIAAVQPVREDLDGPYKQYNLDMKVRRKRKRAQRVTVSPRVRARASMHMSARRLRAPSSARVRCARVPPPRHHALVGRVSAPARGRDGSHAAALKHTPFGVPAAALRARARPARAARRPSSRR
jgi:hypothetical protein